MNRCAASADVKPSSGKSRTQSAVVLKMECPRSFLRQLNVSIDGWGLMPGLSDAEGVHLAAKSTPPLQDQAFVKQGQLVGCRSLECFEPFKELLSLNRRRLDAAPLEALEEDIERGSEIVQFYSSSKLACS